MEIRSPEISLEGSRGHEFDASACAEIANHRALDDDLADIDIPDNVTGHSLVGEHKRETIYCEALEGQAAMRMITDGRWKLIWYPAGNHFQLFDCKTDPDEVTDLASSPNAATHLTHLREQLAKELYGSDLAFIEGDKLIGTSAEPVVQKPNRGLSGQRGMHYPEPPPDDPAKIVGAF